MKNKPMFVQVDRYIVNVMHIKYMEFTENGNYRVWFQPSSGDKFGYIDCEKIQWLKLELWLKRNYGLDDVWDEEYE
jgi:hypothetical protein